jgi:hypothetical protein
MTQRSSSVVNRCEIYNSEIRYRVTLVEKKLEVDQWDDGSGHVDGTKREPRWVKVWGRYL